MQGPMEALVSGILMRGLSPAFTAVLMAAPSRKTVRAQLKKIYVLNDHGDMTGEYILDADCPIDYDDFLRCCPQKESAIETRCSSENTCSRRSRAASWSSSSC